MKITVDGQVYEYDATRLSMREAYRLKEQTGLGLKGWQDAMGEGEALAIAGLVFLVKSRAGEVVDWNTFDFDLASIELHNDEDTDASDPSPEPGSDAPSGT